MKKTLLFCLLVGGCSQVPGNAQTLKNGDFESPYQAVAKPTSPLAQIDGNVADGWRDESGWGEVSIEYAQDTNQMHGGGSAQRINVRSIGKGAVQFVQELPVTAGRKFRFSAYVRSAANASASLMLRKSGNPYTTLGNQDIQITPAWQLFEVTGETTENTEGLVMFLPKTAGTYWIDDARLEDITDGTAPVTAAAAPPPVPTIAGVAAIHVENSGLEMPYRAVTPSTSPKAKIDGTIANGWRDDSGWGEVSIGYSPDAAQAHGGGHSQRIDVRSIGEGGVQFVQDQPLTANRIYRVSAYLRAAVSSKATLQLRQNGAPYEIFGQVVANPSPEWRYFQAFAKVTTTSNGLILFSPTEPGTYWIDDVKLEDVTETLALQNTAHTGNLFEGGSFETGLSDGWHMRIAGFDKNELWASREHLDLKPSVDSTTAADGEKSISVKVGAWSAGLLGSPLTPVTFGRAYTASIALKSDQPTTVGISIDGTTSSQDVQVGPNWQRYSLSGTATTGTTARLRARFIVRDSDKPVTFWADSAMLEESAMASPHYVAAHPVEVGLNVPRPGSIVFDGEAVPLEVQAVSSDGGALPAGARLKWSVENLAGQRTTPTLVDLPLKTLSIAPDAKAPRGVFKVHAQIVDANGKPLSGEIEKVFARLPHPKTLTPAQAEKSYFGIHIDLQPEKIAIANAIGQRWVRLHDASTATIWPIVEPQPGQYKWNEEGIKLARASGLNVLGMLAGAPNWTAKKPQAENGFFASWNVPDAPGATEKWAEYVRKTVTHYKPWISHWEIWNEPYINSAQSGFFPNGTPEQYADLLLRASKGVRESNPNATIIGVCSPGNANEWLDRVLKNAGPSNYDVMSFHGYYNRLQGGAQSQVSVLAKGLTAAQSKYGTAKSMWNTEGSTNDNVSWYIEPTSAMRYQMAALVRLDVAQIAAGIGKFFVYTLHGDADHGEGGLYLLEHDLSLKPAIAARAMLENLIDGLTYVGRTEPVAGVEAHTFKQTNGETVQVVWSFDSKKNTVTVPAGQKALDILGNTLTAKNIQVGDEPIYFVKK